jgi:aminoglycoside 6'-N-acetyltransferase
VELRDATHDDVDALVAIRSTPEVHARWGGDDLRAEVVEAIEEPDLHFLVIEVEGEVVGAIQWEANDDPQYRYAGIDVFLDPSVHGRGIGTEAVRTLARHLVEVEGHHRLVIDPAADNTAAIRCYEKVGFKPVGVMRRYELAPDGTWRDGLLMDLLAEELT